MPRKVVDSDSDSDSDDQVSYADLVKCMNDFKNYKPDGTQKELDKFSLLFAGVTVEDYEIRMRFTYGVYLCIVMYEPVADCYSVSWFKNEKQMDSFPEYRNKNVKNAWTMFWKGCFLYFQLAPKYQGLYSVSGPDVNDNNRENQQRAAAGSASASGPLQEFVRQHARGPPPPYQRNASLGYNSSNVIGMLYELRDMCRSMHDGARTLR